MISPFFFLHLLLLRQIAAIVCSCRHQESTGRPGLDLTQLFALSSALPISALGEAAQSSTLAVPTLPLEAAGSPAAARERDGTGLGCCGLCLEIMAAVP